MYLILSRSPLLERFVVFLGFQTFNLSGTNYMLHKERLENLTQEVWKGLN